MPENMDPSKPVSYTELLGRCMGEEQFARTVLNGFVESSRPQMQAIRDDIQRNDWEGLARKVHRFKGTAATVAAGPLRAALESLEEAIRHQQDCRDEDSIRSLEQAEQELDRLVEFVHSELGSR